MHLLIEQCLYACVYGLTYVHSALNESKNPTHAAGVASKDLPSSFTCTVHYILQYTSTYTCSMHVFSSKRYVG